MKKLFFVLIGLCLSLSLSSQASAYDWQSQPNEELHADMVTFAKGFAKRSKGTPEGKIVKNLLKQQKTFSVDKYAWIQQTVSAVLEMEKICTPTVDNKSREALMRRDMLLLLDFPLHADNKADDAPEGLKKAFESVSDSYRSQGRERALAQLAKEGPVKAGELQIIKIYNCGVILRTNKHTIAVDVKWEGDAEGAKTIAAKADAFFLSHPHRDHYSDVMIKALAEFNVTSIMPKNVVPDVQWAGKKVIYEDRLEPFDIDGIRTVIQTGYQKKVPNNAYILEFDGWRILLPGESGLYKRLYELSSHKAPDLILVPTWNRANKVFYAVSRMKDYRPEGVVCIPEHENELTHTVNHRESYKELFLREDRLGDASAQYPRIFLLDIGESITLKK